MVPGPEFGDGRKANVHKAFRDFLFLGVPLWRCLEQTLHINDVFG